MNTIGKFLTFLYTGSSTLLSESLHSLADVANQSILLIGVWRSQRPPTQDHPYGFEGERFVYALISATGIFFVGACVSFYHGLHHFLYPTHLEDLWLGLAMMSFSAAVESVSFASGVYAVRKGAKENGMGFFEFLKKGPDPMGVAVVMEDGAALVGIVIALSCLGLSYHTNNSVYDAFGSMLIGTLLGSIAIFLIIKNARSLSTRAAPPQKRARIVNLLKADPIVNSLHDIKAIQIGTESVAFSADVEFNGEALARQFLEANPSVVLSLLECQHDVKKTEEILLKYGAALIELLGDEVDRLEKKIKKEIPEVKYVDLESN